MFKTTIALSLIKKLWNAYTYAHVPYFFMHVTPRYALNILILNQVGFNILTSTKLYMINLLHSLWKQGVAFYTLANRFFT